MTERGMEMTEHQTDTSPEWEPGAHTPAHTPETKQLQSCSPLFPTLCVFPTCLSLSTEKLEGERHEASPALCKRCWEHRSGPGGGLGPKNGHLAFL